MMKSLSHPRSGRRRCSSRQRGILPTLALMMLMAASALAGADDDRSHADFARAEALIKRLADETTAVRQRCVERYVPLVKPTRHKTAEQRVVERIDRSLKQLRDAAAQLQRHHQRYLDRHKDLIDFVRVAHDVQHRAISAAWNASLEEAGWAVWRLGEANAREARDLRAEHHRAAAELETHHPDGGAALKAAQRALGEAFLRRETRLLEEKVTQHRQVTEALVLRRRELCRLQWQLQDYQAQRSRDRLSRKALAGVYQTFAYDLPGRGRRFHDRVFGYWSARNSSLDYFVNMPGSPDRLILRRLWNRDMASLHKMNAAFAAEPVEMLRVAETNLPVLNPSGNVVEKFCRILSARLQHYYRLEAQQQHLERTLTSHGERMGQLGSLNGLAAVKKDLADLLGRQVRVARGEVQARHAHDEAENRIADQRRRLADAERALREAPARIYVDGKSLQRVEGEGDGHVPAADKLAAIERSIANYERMLADPNLGAGQRVAMLEHVMPRLTGERDKVAKVIDEAVKPLRAQRDAIDLALKQARVDLLKVPPAAGDATLAQAWRQARQAYEKLRTASARLPPALPALPESLAEADAVFTVIQAMQKLHASVNVERRDVRNQILAEMGRMTANDQTLGRLARNIVSLRVSGAVTAAHALEQLGAKADDEVMVHLRKLTTDFGRVKAVVDTFDQRMERLDHGLAFLTEDKAGREIIAKVRDRLKIVKTTFSVIGDYGAKAKQVREIIDLMEDDRTALDALGKALKLTSALGGKVPVIGQTVGQFIAFYADAAVAAGGAARSIQAHLIEQDIDVHFSQPPPERHLYTQSELANLRVGNEAARRRVLTMLQARRLIALTSAADLGHAIDMKRAGH